MAHDTHRVPPPEEAVGLAVDSFVAALTLDQVEAMIARTHPEYAQRNTDNLSGAR